jgi:hypothetical protein
MSRLRFSDEFTAAQPASNTEPQKIENFVKPFKANGWLVHNPPAKPARSKLAELIDNPLSHRDYTPERGESVASEYHAAPVTLPKIEWPSARHRTESRR